MPLHGPYDLQISVIGTKIDTYIAHAANHFYHPRMRHGNVFGRVHESVCNTLTFQSLDQFISVMQVGLQDDQVKFVYQGHRVKVKVKVTGAKKRV